MKERELYLFAFKILGNFGVSIAVPAVLAALLGKWLDSHFGTSPWLLILCFVIAFVLTAMVIYKKAKEFGKKYQELTGEK